MLSSAIVSKVNTPKARNQNPRQETIKDCEGGRLIGEVLGEEEDRRTMLGEETGEEDEGEEEVEEEEEEEEKEEEEEDLKDARHQR